MQAHSQEGDHPKTSGPHLEINDNSTVCKPLHYLLNISCVYVTCSFSLYLVVTVLF